MLGNEQKIRLLPGDKVQKGKKMKLYIIRHGETSWNKQKKLQGQRDIMLNDAGIRLAELTGEGMKDIDFDLVISSPLIRAKQTAELVMAGRHLPMITDNIMGTEEYPIPRSAPGKRSMMPHRKYGTVVMESISNPHAITSGSLV